MRSLRVPARGEPLALGAILSLAAVLRLYALTGRGFIYWDEAKFALEGIRVQAYLRALSGVPVSLLAGKPIGTAKPTHALLIALSYAVLGVHDYAPLLLNAVAGIIEVALTYLIGRRLFGQRVGLIAALFLAVSEYDIIYARSALSEIDANMLLLAGVLFWIATAVRPEAAETFSQPEASGSQQMETSAERHVRPTSVPRHLLAAGLLMGLAFTTNYRLIIYIALLVGLDLAWIWRSAGWKGDARRLPLWAAGLAAAPLAWQAIDVVARAHGLVLFRSEITHRPMWYLGEVLYQLHEGKQAAFHFSPLAYVQWYVVRQGWPMLVLLVVGLILAAYRRSFAWLTVAILVVLPYAIYVFAPFVVPRNLDAALPFASLLAAGALVSVLGRRPALSRAALPALVLVLSGLGAMMAWRLTTETSGFARAAAYVDERGGRALTNNEILVFYLRGSGAYCNAPEMPFRLPHLAAYLGAGYRYAIVDPHTSHVIAWVRAHQKLAARFPATGALSIGENPIQSENSIPPNPHASPEYVDVYRLNDLPSPLRGWHPKLCRRDHIA